MPLISNPTVFSSTGQPHVVPPRVPKGRSSFTGDGPDFAGAVRSMASDVRRYGNRFVRRENEAVPLGCRKGVGPCFRPGVDTQKAIFRRKMHQSPTGRERLRKKRRSAAIHAGVTVIHYNRCRAIAPLR